VAKVLWLLSQSAFGRTSAQKKKETDRIHRRTLIPLDEISGIKIQNEIYFEFKKK